MTTSHHTSEARASAPDQAQLATDLRIAVNTLIRRFRAEAEMPIPQLQALGLIARLGPRTTSQLAAHERMRPQSMAQTVALLEEAGLVERRPDPDDGRQQLIALTTRGEGSILEFRRSAEAWVTDAIAARLTPGEQAELARGVELLGRLTDLDQ
ncbi:MAG: MarR family transcriptional regulator [Solirubrobacteraceae bacterium]|nr:MarR family transcriptional regulator [Solirubrobacteraceae bacterium]